MYQIKSTFALLLLGKNKGCIIHSNTPMKGEDFLSTIVFSPEVSILYASCNQYQEYRNCCNLCLSKRQAPRAITRQDLLVKILTYPYKPSVIEEAVLSLPIQRISSCNPHFYNTIRIRTLTAQDSFPSVDFLSEPTLLPITEDSIYDDVLSIPITQIVADWDFSTNPLMILLELQHPNLGIFIRNQLAICPKVQMKGTFEPMIPVISPVPSDPICVMLSLAASTYQRAEIAPLAKIMFDTIFLESSPYITYDTENGTFSINEPGNYYFSWIVNLLGCCALRCISIGIRNEENGYIHDFHAPCIMPSQICGQQIIPITESHTTFSFINNSEALLQLSNIDTQASLIVLKI